MDVMCKGRWMETLEGDGWGWGLTVGVGAMTHRGCMETWAELAHIPPGPDRDRQAVAWLASRGDGLADRRVDAVVRALPTRTPADDEAVI